MKSFSGSVSSDRRAWHRADMIDLLGGNVTLMERIERAENDYLFFVGTVAENYESDRSVHEDLKAMRDALEVLQSLYSPGGRAKALFEGEAAKLSGTTSLQGLRNLFGGTPGEALVMAVKAALESHQVRGGRPSDPLKVERMCLVGSIALIAEQAAISVNRQDRAGNPSMFESLLQFVFDRVEIEIKPDTAIKNFLETHATIEAG